MPDLPSLLVPNYLASAVGMDRVTSSWLMAGGVKDAEQAVVRRAARDAGRGGVSSVCTEHPNTGTALPLGPLSTGLDAFCQALAGQSDCEHVLITA